MKLTNDMTLADFRDEMQHRVIKYALQSKPVREAVRFARRNPDPHFYRVALDKIDAQKQFRHERYGPSLMQRIVDLLGGGLREVTVTMVFVVVVLVALDFAGSWWTGPPETGADVDLDRLAERIGFSISRSSGAASAELKDLEQEVSDKIDRGIQKAKIDEVLSGKFASLIDQSRFEEVAVAKLGERLETTNLEPMVTRQLARVLDEPTLKQLVADRVDQQLAAAGIKERVLAEFQSALDEVKLDERLSRHIDGQLVKFERELAERARQFQEQIAATLIAVMEGSEIEQRIAQRIDRQLEKVDEQLENKTQALETLADKREVTPAPRRELVLSGESVELLAAAIRDQIGTTDGDNK